MDTKSVSDFRYKKVSIQDIAKAANTSTATVSRVINGNKNVKPELKTKVEYYIKALNYVRTGAAIALASSKSKLVGIIIPTLDNAIFASGIASLEKSLNTLGYTLIITVNHYKSNLEVSLVTKLIEKGVDGIILIGNTHTKEVYNLLNANYIPFINMWSYKHDSEPPCVGFDNKIAMQNVTQYLIDQGHSRFAYISGIINGNDRAKDRVDGFKLALNENNLPVLKHNIIETKYAIEYGRQATKRLIERAPIERPTAILCGNDVLATGCIFECQDKNLCIPKDVAIVGFDNLPLSKHLTPSLTTIKIPTAEMGEKAALMLIDKINGEAPSNTELLTELIVRNSTG